MAYVSGRLAAGQKTGITTTPVVLATGQPACREVLVQSDPANTTNVLIGNSTAQYVNLTPGQSLSIPILGLDQIYVAMASGTGVINWLARD